MRKTMVLMAIGVLFFLGAAFAVDGVGKDSPSAGTVKSRTFNVLNYGAVGDDKTDNTEAFSACLKAVIAAGYFVQLPNFSGQPNDIELGDENFSGTRLAQFKALKSIPNTGMAVTIDTSDTGDLHPNNKRDVGDRLAQWALVRDYGRNDLICSGPLYKGMKIEGSMIRVMFDSIGKGLIVGKKNGEEKMQEVPAEKLGCFALAIADPSNPKGLKWSWADAVIDGDTVVVSSPDIPNPVAVEYACICNPTGNKLYNKEGLPASPFRSDGW